MGLSYHGENNHKSPNVRYGKRYIEHQSNNRSRFLQHYILTSILNYFLCPSLEISCMYDVLITYYRSIFCSSALSNDYGL